LLVEPTPLKKDAKVKIGSSSPIFGMKNCHHPVVSVQAKLFFSDMFLVLWLIIFCQKIIEYKKSTKQNKNGFIQNVLMILLPQQCCQKVCGMLVGVVIHPRIAFCSESQTRRDCNDQTSARSKCPLGWGHPVLETGSGWRKGGIEQSVNRNR